MSLPVKMPNIPLPPNLHNNNRITNSVAPVVRPRKLLSRSNRARSEFYSKQKSNQFDSTKIVGNSKRRPYSHQINPCTNLFVNYLPPEFTDADLRKLFAPYGHIICSKVMVNLETGESKCFGFVRLENLADAQNAISSLNGMQVGRKRLLVKYAESKEKPDPESDLIYIKQIPIQINKDDIANLFAPYGKILQIVPHNIDINPYVWRCFVRYETIHSASKAIEEMNNKIVIPDTKPLYVRYAETTCIPNHTNVLYPENQTSEIDEIDEKMLLPSFLRA